MSRVRMAEASVFADHGWRASNYFAGDEIGVEGLSTNCWTAETGLKHAPEDDLSWRTPSHLVSASHHLAMAPHMLEVDALRPCTKGIPAPAVRQSGTSVLLYLRDAVRPLRAPYRSVSLRTGSASLHGERLQEFPADAAPAKLFVLSCSLRRPLIETRPLKSTPP